MPGNRLTNEIAAGDGRLRQLVSEGLADLDAGPYDEFSDENLHDLFDGIAARGRERLKLRDGARPDPL
jgi:hypothetical protein